jgi:hypothetical protein
MTRPRIEPVSALVAFGLIAFATLTPTWGSPRTGFLCLGCGDFGAPDVVVNLALFLPLGIVIGRAGLRPLVALGAGLAVSGAIEFAQQFIPGRAPTLRDVLMNGTGCGLGALLAWRLGGWLAPGPRARVLLWLSVTGVFLALGLTGALLRFEPPGGTYYGQWVPDQGHLERWRGRLRDALVSGIAVPDGPSRRSEELRASVRDRLEVELDAVAGPPTRRLSSIFSVMNDAQQEVLLVGPRREDLIVRVRRAAATWRMDAPEFVFPHALAGIAPGTPLAIGFAGTREGGCATVNDARHCVGRPRAGSTWRLARSFEYAPPLVQRVLDCITLLVLVLPFGLLVRSVPRREAVAAGLLLLAGFPLVAWTSGLTIPMLWEWLGVALGVTSGLEISRRVAPTARG